MHSMSGITKVNQLRIIFKLLAQPNPHDSAEIFSVRDRRSKAAATEGIEYENQ